jgi:hypothetical protein
VLELPAKSHTGTISGTIPASNENSLLLTLRTRTWFPRKLIPGSQDPRELGVAVFSLEMKAEGAAGEPLNANTGD